MTKAIIVISILIALIVFWRFENKSIVLTGRVYQNPKLPELFEGFSIALVSDLQSEYFGKDQKNLLEIVKSAEPDIIVFAGDLVDRNHTNYPASIKAMAGLSQIAPVYYVNGNHELALPSEDLEKMYDELKTMGVTLLFDTATVIERGGQTIHLIGLSEETLLESKESEGRLAKAYDSSVIDDAIVALTAGIGPEDFTMMLAHEPQFFETYARKEVDLIFCGHAHGGQVRLPFTQGLFSPGQGVLPKLTAGVHKIGTTSMVISRGLGNSVIPFRVFNRPEIVSIELKREKEN